MENMTWHHTNAVLRLFFPHRGGSRSLRGMALLCSLPFLLAGCSDPQGRHQKPLATGGLSASEQAKNCPDWSLPSTHNFYNRDHSNFGCATYTNILTQVDNPRDLERGRGKPHESSGETSGDAIDTYRASFGGDSASGSEGSAGGESSSASSSSAASSAAPQ